MHAMQLAGRPPFEIPDDAPPPPPLPQHEEVNNAFESTLLKKFAELTAELSELKQGMGQRTSRSSHGRTPKRYCWTCGCCAHWGRDCEAKRPGHKDAASFKDRKGGSDKDCRPNV